MRNSTGSFYNRITFLYPLINLFLERQRKLLIKEVNSCPHGELLEIGVGTGSHLPSYTHNITGIDISEAMLAKAKHHESDNVKLMLMDGENLLFPEAYFDYVVISHVLAVVQDPGLVLDQAYKVLRPGGRLFILNHFTPHNWMGYIDRAVSPLASLLHFKSTFYMRDLRGLQRFDILKQTGSDSCSYFKILICSKS